MNRSLEDTAMLLDDPRVLANITVIGYDWFEDDAIVDIGQGPRLLHALQRAMWDADAELVVDDAVVREIDITVRPLRQRARRAGYPTKHDL